MLTLQDIKQEATEAKLERKQVNDAQAVLIYREFREKIRKPDFIKTKIADAVSRGKQFAILAEYNYVREEIDRRRRPPRDYNAIFKRMELDGDEKPLLALVAEQLDPEEFTVYAWYNTEDDMYDRDYPDTFHYIVSVHWSMRDFLPCWCCCFGNGPYNYFDKYFCATY